MGLVYYGRNPEFDGMLWVDENADIHDMENPVINKSFLKYTPHKWASKSNVPLFKKKKLDVGDINQESVGDCWYLSALAAIVNLPYGSALIKKTMVDCHNGKVIVRFFDGDYLPVYISLNKSVFWYMGLGKLHASRSNKTGLWPLMLEKAATCMVSSSGFTICDPQHPTYKNIAKGGESHNAFRMLLGCKGNSEICTGRNQVGADNSGDHVKLLFDQKWFMGAGGIKQMHRDALQAVFGNIVTVERWSAEFKKLINRGSPLITGKYMVGKVAYRRNFYQLMNSPGITGLDRELGLRLAAYAQTHRVYSRKMGTGVYSQGALHLFDKIKSYIVTNRPLCMGTKQGGWGVSEGRGKNPSESKTKGMVQHHAYAILDVLEENVMTKRKYIKVANPWGHYGRMYTENYNTSLTISPKEQNSGVSLIELTDFCDMIMSLYMCEQDQSKVLAFL